MVMRVALTVFLAILTVWEAYFVWMTWPYLPKFAFALSATAILALLTAASAKGKI